MSDSRSALFKSFSKEGIVRREALFEALKERGILEDDPRLKALFKALNGSSPEISEAQFQILSDQAPGLFEQALTDGLAIPDFNAFTRELTDIFDEVNTIRMGKLPTYIPQLERVDPEKFAMSVCTVDGQRFSIGECDD